MGSVGSRRIRHDQTSDTAQWRTVISTPPAGQPANVAGQDPTRVGGRRLVACAIDVGLGFVIYVVLFILLSRRAPLDTFVGRTSNVCAGRGVSCAVVRPPLRRRTRRLRCCNWCDAGYLVGVFVIQRGLTGSTLGTRLLGIVTVGHDGQPIGPVRALWRSVAGIVDYLPCCVPIVGIVTIFATTGHRRVGDMAAKSLVVERAHLGSPILVPAWTPVWWPARPRSGHRPCRRRPAPATGPPHGVSAGAHPPGLAVPDGRHPTPGRRLRHLPVRPAARHGRRVRRPSPGRSPTRRRCRPRRCPRAGRTVGRLPAPADPTQPQWDADRRGLHASGTGRPAAGCSSTRPPRSGARSDQARSRTVAERRRRSRWCSTGAAWPGGRPRGWRRSPGSFSAARQLATQDLAHEVERGGGQGRRPRRCSTQQHPTRLEVEGHQLVGSAALGAGDPGWAGSPRATAASRRRPAPPTDRRARPSARSAADEHLVHAGG